MRGVAASRSNLRHPEIDARLFHCLSLAFVRRNYVRANFFNADASILDRECAAAPFLTLCRYSSPLHPRGSGPLAQFLTFRRFGSRPDYGPARPRPFPHVSPNPCRPMSHATSPVSSPHRSALPRSPHLVHGIGPRADWPRSKLRRVVNPRCSSKLLTFALLREFARRDEQAACVKKEGRPWLVLDYRRIQ